jgi:aldehyde dehydrogenase (NAD+)
MKRPTLIAFDYVCAATMQNPTPHHFINNRWIAAATGQTVPVIDPSDGSTFAQLARGTGRDIDAAVGAARHAFDAGAWGKLAPVERGRLLSKLAHAIVAHHDQLAQLEMRDCGKPLKQAKADATACARYFEFYAGACDKFHGDTIPYTPGYAVMTWREPHGVTGHIIPWNYPMQIFGRSVGASLAAGNACVVKPAEDACLSLLRIAALAAEVGFPDGALNIVTGLGNEAGAALAQHHGIDHISFTGSPTTGAWVAQTAAQRHCPVTLELGGKSPQIVFDDADIAAAMPTLVNAIVQNAGQTCSAGSRVLIHRKIYDSVLSQLAQRFAALQVGPAAQDLDVGPIIRANQLARIRGLVQQGLDAGARTVARGTLAADAPAGGFFQVPTLLDGLAADQSIARDEIFGPVLVALPFDDEADAIRIANATAYGLVAGVWTENGARALRMAKAVKSGQVFINNYGAGGGVELPFGGVKSSGYGREKGFEALYGFTQLKTVVTRYA